MDCVGTNSDFVSLTRSPSSVQRRISIRIDELTDVRSAIVQILEEDDIELHCPLLYLFHDLRECPRSRHQAKR